MNPRIESLEKMLNTPRDNALLRFSLGNEYLKADDSLKAAAFFQSALDIDEHYSAAWKGLGKALTEAGKFLEALGAYEKGIAIANERGDIQAAKEMGIFAKRLSQKLGS